MPKGIVLNIIEDCKWHHDREDEKLCIFFITVILKCEFIYLSLDVLQKIWGLITKVRHDSTQILTVW